jgi:hypothetical protein
MRTSNLATVLEGQKVDHRLSLRKFGSMIFAIQIHFPRLAKDRMIQRIM